MLPVSLLLAVLFGFGSFSTIPGGRADGSHHTKGRFIAGISKTQAVSEKRPAKSTSLRPASKQDRRTPGIGSAVGGIQARNDTFLVSQIFDLQKRLIEKNLRPTSSMLSSLDTPVPTPRTTVRSRSFAQYPNAGNGNATLSTEYDTSAMPSPPNRPALFIDRIPKRPGVPFITSLDIERFRARFRSPRRIHSSRTNSTLQENRRSPSSRQFQYERESPRTHPQVRTFHRLSSSPLRSSSLFSSGVDSRIVLNSAREEDLLRIPGIGPGRARLIIENRPPKGYRSWKEIAHLPGIGRQTLELIRSHAVLCPPIPAPPSEPIPSRSPRRRPRISQPRSFRDPAAPTSTHQTTWEEDVSAPRKQSRALSARNNSFQTERRPKK